MKKKSLLGVMTMMTMSALANTPNYQLHLTLDQEAYQRPAQTATASIEVSPKLDKLHTLVISIDGKAVSYNQISHQFATVDYNPGEHIVRVEIQNEMGRAIVADEKAVYFIQNTPLIRAQREYAKQKAEYESLSWFQRIGRTKPLPPQTATIQGVQGVTTVPTTPTLVK